MFLTVWLQVLFILNTSECLLLNHFCVTPVRRQLEVVGPWDPSVEPDSPKKVSQSLLYLLWIKEHWQIQKGEFCHFCMHCFTFLVSSGVLCAAYAYLVSYACALSLLFDLHVPTSRRVIFPGVGEVLPPGDIWQRLGTFLVVLTGDWGATSI